MEEITYNSRLDAIASITKALYAGAAGAPRVMRLQVDYKGPDGADRNMDFLATIPRSCKTMDLVDRIQATLPEGCKLSAVSSVDHMRPLYIAPGFLEESFTEQGLTVPDDWEAAGLKLMTLEEDEQ